MNGQQHRRLIHYHRLATRNKFTMATSKTNQDLEALAQAVYRVSTAITPDNSAGGNDASGGYVTSLTEAVMGITSGLYAIAESNREIARSNREIADKAEWIAESIKDAGETTSESIGNAGGNVAECIYHLAKHGCGGG